MEAENPTQWLGLLKKALSEYSEFQKSPSLQYLLIITAIRSETTRWFKHLWGLNDSAWDKIYGSSIADFGVRADQPLRAVLRGMDGFLPGVSPHSASAP
jgi:hypothetical protein